MRNNYVYFKIYSYCIFTIYRILLSLLTLIIVVIVSLERNQLYHYPVKMLGYDYSL